MNPHKIIQTVVDVTGVTMWEMQGKTKHPEVVAARWLCWRLLRDMTHWSLPDIGAEFCKHHTAVLYALRVDRKDPRLEECKARLRSIEDAVAAGFDMWAAEMKGGAV